jgi:hypothetical protein
MPHLMRETFQCQFISDTMRRDKIACFWSIGRISSRCGKIQRRPVRDLTSYAQEGCERKGERNK